MVAKCTLTGEAGTADRLARNLICPPSGEAMASPREKLSVGSAAVPGPGEADAAAGVTVPRTPAAASAAALTRSIRRPPDPGTRPMTSTLTTTSFNSTLELDDGCSAGGFCQQ